MPVIEWKDWIYLNFTASSADHRGWNRDAFDEKRNARRKV